MGGYGKCGRPLCCTTWLGKLESISMEMVREQALKVKEVQSSGSWWLLCCLKYEVGAYKELQKIFAGMGYQVVLKNRIKTLIKKKLR